MPGPGRLTGIIITKNKAKTLPHLKSPDSPEV